MGNINKNDLFQLNLQSKTSKLRKTLKIIYKERRVNYQVCYLMKFQINIKRLENIWIMDREHLENFWIIIIKSFWIKKIFLLMQKYVAIR
ncbi:unnamed protein product [Paramecium primaurelia]|uniref:Uncharacterized protein n=1 Tax=Paramecium primaurelia TaxID=5886 RepID=A0A8S1MU18_PARPR|nr:unnamed protein product [Paramecium primaurelia]